MTAHNSTYAQLSMKEQIEIAYPTETLYRVTVTKPAKRLLGIAAER